MKKILLFLLALVILVPLIVGGIVGYAYYNTKETSVPPVVVKANGAKMLPSGYEWHQPVFGGLLYRDFIQSGTADSASLGVLETANLPLEFPASYDSTIRLQKNNAVVLEGEAALWNGYALPGNGQYILDITARSHTKEGMDGYGVFYYRIEFSLEMPPEVAVSSNRVAQGDVMAIQITYLPEGVQPQAETEIGMVTFTPTGPSSAAAMVPVTYNREPGDYLVHVTAGEHQWDIPLTVVPTDYTRQDLTIDTSDPEVSEANSPAAYQQYRDKIYPLFETADEQTYWQGLFIQPAQGRISTEYGLRRYTNGAATPTRHSGLDIAAPEGTAVIAPNDGRVVMAEYLLNTGNTLVIEHGGGLKSYFFHLSELNVSVGDMVKKGDRVGAVGTTGYSTGPHLHYEVRIGNQSISPPLLFSGESGLYYFDTQR